MSIDAPSAMMPVDKALQDQFNYIDTYVEYIAEVILKFDNAIPESKTRDHKEMQQHKHVEIAFQKITSLLHIFYLNNKERFSQSSSDSYAYQFVKEINPPPPKGC